MLALINIVGVMLIALIAWWFWFYKPKDLAIVDDLSVILVENGRYSPSHIVLAENTPATLTFLRRDASACAEVVMIPELGINETLPVDTQISIELPALAAGEYAFHCQMQM
ncbi:MAG: cupredoxin domain-containing protein, partial [Arenicella sp.]|nr:cupredoxin domain-containing protein [Arenicella sp.]